MTCAHTNVLPDGSLDPDRFVRWNLPPRLGYDAAALNGELLVTIAMLPVVWGAILTPGYVTLRSWFDRRSAALFSFVASVVLVHSSVLLLQLVDAPITGATVTATLGVFFAIAFATSRNRTLRFWRRATDELRGIAREIRLTLRSMDRASWVVAALVIAMIAVVSIDFARDPLVRQDNTFRWGNLANRLYALGTLDFYPPRTAADYAIYNFPDGIAPELAVMFWWCFVVSGSAAPLHALGFIQLQSLWWVLLIAALSAAIGERSAYRRGAMLACCAATTLSTISCGAESGLLALGTTAAVLCLLRLKCNAEARWAYLAIICASVASLAREYGLATIALTLCVITAQRRPLREIAAASAIAGLLAGSWYLRTWIRSGNPFFILDVGGLFPGIPVHTHYLQRTAALRALSAMPLSELSRLVFWLVWGAPIAWLIGAPVAIRRAMPIPLVFAIAWILVWLKATTYSAGGYGFALRVASPAIAIFTAFASDWRWPSRSRTLQTLAVAVVALLYVKTATDLLSGTGARVFRVPLSDFLRPVERPPAPFPEQIASEVRGRGGRVLSANGHFAPVMRAYELDLAPIWSPEFSFLFDPAVTAAEITWKLRELHVFFYIPVDWTEFTDDVRARTLSEAFAGWRPLLASEPELLAAD